MNDCPVAEQYKFLAVDTASSHLTALAVNGKKVALRFSEDCALRHSVLLMGEVERVMDEVGLTAADCDFFCAVTGPGSFTGIRIGVSAAKGMALATDKKLLSLTSFQLIAYNVTDCNDFFAVVDAAHSHSYACRAVRGELGQPQYISREDLLAYGLPLYGFQPLDLPRYTCLAAGECLLPAVNAALERGMPFGGMHALYVRKSQAEEGRK